jgi:ubiquinone/menaquinone biosynthesis C-methylase UbiE
VVNGFDPRVISAAYDAVADEYVDTFGADLGQLELDRGLLDDLAVQCAGRGAVLDLGCGPGHVGRYLSARAVEVVGVDFAPAMLAVARRMEPGAALVSSDIRALPIRTDSVIGAVAFYVLQHLRRADLGQTLQELRRVLVVGGVVALAVHEGEGEFHPTTEITASSFTRAEITRALRDASFSVETARRRPPLAHERQGERLYLTARAT